MIVLMNVAYKNFGIMDSKALAGYTQNGIFALVLKEIVFTVSIFKTYHTLWTDLFLFLKRQWKN